eukprot:1182387-Amphidinium_carterae.1
MAVIHKSLKKGSLPTTFDTEDEPAAETTDARVRSFLELMQELGALATASRLAHKENLAEESYYYFWVATVFSKRQKFILRFNQAFD